MKTKIILLLASISIVNNVLAFEFKLDGLIYRALSNTQTYVTVYGDTKCSVITIPETVTYNGREYNVTAIGAGAFKDFSSLTSITIPKTIKSIGDGAFNGCTNLTKTNFTGDIADWCTIHFTPSYAASEHKSNPIYYSHNLYINDVEITDLVIPDSVICIEECAFCKCSSLTSVFISNSVTRIGSQAFRDCSSLSHITIGSSVKSIEGNAFLGCTALTKTNYIGDIANWCAIQFGLRDSNPIYYSQNLYIKDVEVNVLIIPSPATCIKQYAFVNCLSLSSVNIANSVMTIERYAFEGCSSITSATIPNSVISIGDEAFYNVPNIIYSGTATGTPWGARSVNGYVEKYFVYESEAKTQLLACSSAAKGNITIANSVTNIGKYAFNDCASITSITIPNSVINIDDYAFTNCPGLTSITLPNSVTNIGGCIFENCLNLSSVIIGGDSMMNISPYAFDYCKAITSITWDIKNHKGGWTTGGTVYDKNYKDFSPFYKIRDQITSFVFGNNVEDIPACLCCGLDSLTSVTISNSVKNIGYDAFYDCRSLTSITLPNSIKYIGTGAFEHCVELNSINIPNSVTGIANYAFSSCYSLTSINIGNSVTWIGDYAFDGCSSLSDVTIGESIKVIGSFAFAGCFAITKTNYTGDIADWCMIQFSNNISNPIYYSHNLYIKDVEINDLEIPNSVKKIGEYAFYNCYSLRTITIPHSVTRIMSSAFYSCKAISDVYCKAMTPPECAPYCFDYIPTDCKLHVPLGTKTAYQTKYGWKQFYHIFEEDFTNLLPETHVSSPFSTTIRKVLYNGQIFIQKGNNKTYTVTGIEL